MTETGDAAAPQLDLAAALAALVELEARWENLPRAGPRGAAFLRIRWAAIEAFESALPGAGRVLFNQEVIEDEQAYRFDTLQAASKRLVYPPEFLELPPAIYQATAPAQESISAGTNSRTRWPRRRRRLAIRGNR